MPFYDNKVYVISVVAIDAPEGMTLEDIQNGGWMTLPSAISRSEIVQWEYLSAGSEIRDCAIDASRKLNESLNRVEDWEQVLERGN